MNCEVCKRMMHELFFSVACEHCKYGPDKTKCHRGFIVKEEEAPPGHEYYVFRTAMDATRWQTASGKNESGVVWEVYSLEPYRWHLSRGTLRDVVLADHMFEIYPDHRYAPATYRAFLNKEYKT